MGVGGQRRPPLRFALAAGPPRPGLRGHHLLRRLREGRRAGPAPAPLGGRDPAPRGPSVFVGGVPRLLQACQRVPAQPDGVPPAADLDDLHPALRAGRRELQEECAAVGDAFVEAGAPGVLGFADARLGEVAHGVCLVYVCSVVYTTLDRMRATRCGHGMIGRLRANIARKINSLRDNADLCGRLRTDADNSGMAEGQGFEPWEAFASLVFKTSAFDRSATPPGRAILSFSGVVFNPVRAAILPPLLSGPACRDHFRCRAWRSLRFLRR